MSGNLPQVATTSEAVGGGSAATLRQLNVNLLYALDAILAEPTLTRAGGRVGRSQPAMSQALRKLRTQFGDELVVYGTGGGVRTDLGEELRPRVQRLLREIDEFFQVSLAFDPVSTQRSITIAAPEAVEAMFVSVAAQRMVSQATGLSVRLVPLDLRSPERAFEQGADVIVLPQAAAHPRFVARPLFVDNLACLVWDGHLSINGAMTRESYLAAHHIAVAESVPPDATSAAILAQRRISIETTLYASVPRLLIGSDLVATVSSWAAQYYAASFALRYVPAPFLAANVTMVAQYPFHRRKEPFVIWVLEQLLDAARTA